MRVLVAEDDAVTRRFLEATLASAAYTVHSVADGMSALKALGAQPFDVLVTDWMMPDMDGLELLRRVRSEVRPIPLTAMATSMSSPDARLHALEAGADIFLVKPVTRLQLLDGLQNVRARKEQVLQPRPAIIGPSTPARKTSIPFVGYAIGASTGGPDAVQTVLKTFDVPPHAVGFIVIHGPDWMQHQCAEMFHKVAPHLEFVVASNGLELRATQVFLAPGNRHMVVDDALRIRLLDTPPVNFVKPAIDPLFSSVAATFGETCVGLILTGLGSDGASGLADIVKHGGRALIQDPDSAVAPFMPRAALKAIGPATPIVPLAGLGKELARVLRITSRIKQKL